MQTFLPYPDFAASAAVLDGRRLGRQRVEVLQLVRALTVPDHGWRHRRPAARMRRGYLEALGAYGVAVAEAWRARGFADTCEATIRDDLAAVAVVRVRTQAELEEAGAPPVVAGRRGLPREPPRVAAGQGPGALRADVPGRAAGAVVRVAAAGPR